MTLQFSEKINGNKTHFVEKILKSFTEYLGCDYSQFGQTNYTSYTIFPKIHTIRNKDTKFKKGTKIHFKQWTGRPYHSQNNNFAPIIPVVSIQNIELKFYRNTNKLLMLLVDDKSLSLSEIHQLAINDGFNSIEDMISYLGKNYKGKIIHWTDFSYQ